MKKIDLDLRQRFVSDNNFPIQVLEDPWFDYYLRLYEDDYGTLSKWSLLKSVIENRFNGSPGKYLDYFYETRNRIITDIEGSEAFQEFIGDKNLFDIYKIPGEIKADLYTGAQRDKIFMSIDLRQANFQALRYHNPEIVKGYETYGDLLDSYDETGLIKESKYTRQVIFGKLNPHRQITIERYLMYLISEDLKDILEFPVFSRQTDEIIYELPKNYKTDETLEKSLVPRIKESLGLDIKVEIFHLDFLQMFSHEGISITGLYKTYIYPWEKHSTLHKVPAQFFSQMYKSWKGLEIDPYLDCVLLHDRQLAHFDYPLSYEVPEDN